MPIKGINIPTYRDSAHISKINSSLSAADVHDHSEGNGDAVERVGEDVVDTNQIRNRAVTTPKIENAAVTYAKIGSDIPFDSHSLVTMSSSDSLLGITQSLTFVEVLSDPGGTSSPITLNGLKTGDIVELFLAPSLSSVPSIFGAIISSCEDYSTQPLISEWAVRDQDSNDYILGHTATAHIMMDSDPMVTIPCGVCSTIIQIQSDGDYTFRLFHRSVFPDVPNFVTTITGGCILCARVYRPTGV